MRNRDFGGGGGGSSGGGGGGTDLPLDVLRIHGACRAMTVNHSNKKKKSRGGSCEEDCAVKTAAVKTAAVKTAAVKTAAVKTAAVKKTALTSLRLGSPLWRSRTDTIKARVLPVE
jgi:hypothetical protein